MQRHHSWHASVGSIGEEAWRRCFGTSDVRVSYGLAKAMDEADVDGTSFHYLMVERSGEPYAVVPCFSYRVSLDALAGPAASWCVAKIRRLLPSALYLRVFVIGTLAGTCRDCFGLDRVPADDLAALLDYSKQEAIARARTLGARLIVAKEFATSQLPLMQQVFSPDFFFVKTNPTTFVPLIDRSRQGYMERLRSKPRRAMRPRLRRYAEAGLKWQVVTDFADLAPELHRLYLNVLERSDYRLETLTPAFFRNVSESLGEQSFVIVAMDGDKPVAFELFLRDETRICPMYLGLDYAYRDSASLYFNCLYRILEEAEVRGYPMVELGQTAYGVKAALGARLGSLHIAFRYDHVLLQALAKALRAQLFPPQPVECHHVFRDEEGALQILLDAGAELDLA